MKWVLILAFCSLGCGTSAVQVQATVADRIARTANGVLPSAVQVYRVQGDQVIDTAPDRASATAGLSALRARWEPVWVAWGVLRGALDLYATALEHGRTSPELLPALQRAWCGYVHVAPTVSLPVPSLPGVLCPP